MGGQGDMSNYSYSGEINQYNFVFGEFDQASIRKMFERIFATYQPKIKSDMFDSFCEDFYVLVRDIQAPNERIWRMIITDMLFRYHERGYLEEASPDNTIKRKQFAIIANVVLGKLRADH
ncbi:hypothetical protein D5274_11700 [bacterium 1XD42-94]|jgi:hypothetical protein|nr:hypothetical protein [bacterium 1XD42-76]NBK05795.1 hypothetical protein [bacterium 1XD42-94]